MSMFKNVLIMNLVSVQNDRNYNMFVFIAKSMRTGESITIHCRCKPKECSSHSMLTLLTIAFRVRLRLHLRFWVWWVCSGLNTGHLTLRLPLSATPSLPPVHDWPGNTIPTETSLFWWTKTMSKENIYCQQSLSWG